MPVGDFQGGRLNRPRELPFPWSHGGYRSFELYLEDTDGHGLKQRTPVRWPQPLMHVGYVPDYE